MQNKQFEQNVKLLIKTNCKPIIVETDVKIPKYSQKNCDVRQILDLYSPIHEYTQKRHTCAR